ncbi:hypothetical protein [Nonomuraea typhae]|uniref:hypothetical protein n=1 Tax=Nonomuraea typhae TaxID=2603600 RepID=UPI0012F952E4|nr:hypothetical protein [Nonomuraea typhae]
MNAVAPYIAVGLIVLMSVGWVLVVHRLESASIDRLRSAEHQHGIDNENRLRAHLAEEAGRYDLDEMAARWRAEDERRDGHG